MQGKYNKARKKEEWEEKKRMKGVRKEGRNERERKEGKNEGGKQRERRVEGRERDRDLKEGDSVLKFSSPAL